jgi:hypothetical protein
VVPIRGKCLFGETMTCCCACSICLTGSCCQFPKPYNFWWTYYPPTQTFVPASLEVTTKVDPKSICPKCGGTSEAKWHPGSWNCFGLRSFNGEHLHRTCQVCGYQWASPTLDAEPKVKEEPDASGDIRCTCPRVKPFDHETIGQGVSWEYKPCPLHPMEVR